jgi:hypothetical protein
LNDDDEVSGDPLVNMDQSAACCVKLIMAVALRFGQVAETTLHEVLLNTAREQTEPFGGLDLIGRLFVRCNLVPASP